MTTYQKRNKQFYVGCKKTDMPSAKIISPEDAFTFIRGLYGEDIDVYESFFMVLLNRRNITDGFIKISHGGIAGTVVDFKLIAKVAIETLSSGVIVAHNHPSGDVTPSKQDIALSRQIRDGLLLFDCVLLDSLVITDKEFFSLKNEGII